MRATTTVTVERCGEYSTITVAKIKHTWKFKIDHEDVDLVLGCEWIGENGGYVSVRHKDQGRIPLHRLIVGAGPYLHCHPESSVVDHKDRDTMNYRRSNLREATHAINGMNRDYHYLSPTGIRGVRASGYGNWDAFGRRGRIGVFDDVRGAIKAVWLELLSIDEVVADNYLRDLPATHDAAKYGRALLEAHHAQ